MGHKSESISAPRIEESTRARAGDFMGSTPDVPPGSAVSAENIKYRVNPEEIAQAPTLVYELSRANNYDADFGNVVAKRTAVIASVQSAMALTQETVRARAWLQHLEVREAQEWNGALKMLFGLRKVFASNQSVDPNFVLRYPQTNAFFGVRQSIAERGAETRKAKAKAKADAPK